MKGQKIHSATSYGVFLVIIGCVLLISLVVTIAFGPVQIPVKASYSVLSSKLFNRSLGIELSGGTEHIIWHIRFPRVLLSAGVGAGLAICGVVIQAIVRNPLANPYVLGISSGASLGATLGIITGLFAVFGQYNVMAGAFLGAVIASFLVFAIAFSGSSANTVKLILTGMAINGIASACTNFVIFLAKNAEGVRTASFWTMGSIAIASWHNIFVPIAVVIIAGGYFYFQADVLNALLLGEDNAIALGVNVPIIRKKYLVITAFVTSVMVSVTGTIGFVGLVIPHIIRMIVGSDNRKVLMASAIVGAIFLIWSDVIARVIMGGEELPIGIVTSLIGGPFFLYMISRKTYGFGDNA